jgi:hypothetical protein
MLPRPSVGRLPLHTADIAANDQAFFPPTHSGCGGVFAVIDRTVSGAIVQARCPACGRIITYGPYGMIR